MKNRFSADDLPRNQDSAAVRGPWPIDLAHARPFRIGEVEVRPPTREVVCGDRRDTLEPRVMEVLVVLAAADGAILSRDDLVTACWGGRAVTDDAINRVLSRLRALGRTFGSFEIETITKVGYRLVEGGVAPKPAAPAAHARPGLKRRTLIVGGLAAAGVAGAGILAWRRPWQHQPPPEAVDLYRRAEMAHRQGVWDQSRQALTYYEQALKIDPLYAEAWGGLALANTHLLEGYGGPGTEGLPARLTSAAHRALELDPDNGDARLALILLQPTFRNWRTKERELRALREQYPRLWLLIGRLAVLLYDVGRLDDGIEIHKGLHDIDPMLPVSYGYLAEAQLNAGRVQEAKATLDFGREHWPSHPVTWIATFTHFLFSDQPQSAEAFLLDPQSRPTDLRQADVEPFLRLARAARSRRTADVEASITDFRAVATANPMDIPFCAVIFALLGKTDLTFQCLERYFFNEGTFGPPVPIQPLTRRYARDLFALPMAPLRADPRFQRILQRIGLEDYWRETGTVPDFRRAS